MKVDISYEAMKNIYRKLGLVSFREQEALNEMAMERKEYITFLKGGILKQLVQNWCLVRYCRFEPKFVTTCRNHWASELRAIAVEISSYKLCKDNKRREKKREATRKIIIDYFEYNDIDTVTRVIHPKFYDENIRSYEDEQFMAIQFIKELDVIIDMITKGAMDDIDAYIEEL